MKDILLRSVPEGYELHKYYDLLPDIVARFDREYRHLFVNQTIEAVTQKKREEFLGKTNIELGMPPELVKVWHDMLEKIFITKKKQETDFEFPAQDGSRFFHMVGNPEFDSQGEVISIFVITRDLTEKKKLQEKLIQSVRQASYFSILSEFTHHLNNPLAILVARLEILEREKDSIPSAKVVEQIDGLQKAVLRIKDLVAAMKKSTPSESSLNIPKYSMMISEVIDAAVQLSSFDSVNPDIGIYRSIQEDFLVESGCGELMEAISELLKNAKESVRTKASPRITLKSLSNQSHWILEIVDSGEEIPNELREKIFDPFFTTKGPSHRGLGLAIVRSRVHSLGGEVSYRREGSENRFQIRLPSNFHKN